MLRRGRGSDDAFQKKSLYLRGQHLGPFVQAISADIGDGVRTDDVGKAGHPHQAGVGFGGIHEDAGDDGCGWEALPLKGNSVVQTARRAAPSIADAGDDNIGVAVQLGHNLRLRRQRSAVLLDVEDLGELELVVEDVADGAEDQVGIGLGIVQ